MVLILRAFIISAAMLTSFHTGASVVIEGTRIVYSARDHEASMRLNNTGSEASLVQIWFDAGDKNSTPETGKAPFIATPPVFRVNPGKSQTVRIIYTREPLPVDRESVFWFNVLDIPPMPVTKDGEDRNYMQLAIRSRIKLFYRPSNLPGSSTEAADKIHWQFLQKGSEIFLRANNDSAFSVSMSTASFSIENQNYEVNIDMVLPGASKDFLVRDLNAMPATPLELEYNTVNDFGATVPHKANL